MLALALQAALAADTVVLYAGDPAAAVARVAADTQKPVWEMAPFRLSERLKGDQPRALGANQPDPCTVQPATNSEVQDAVTRAEVLMTNEQWPRAKEELDAIAQSVACLSEPADASIGARVYYFRGITATALADPSAANQAYLQAFAFQPSLQWDDNYTPDWRSQFDAALAEHNRQGTATLLLGPGMQGQDELWIDGKIASVAGDHVTLPEGQHLVQSLEPAVRTVPLRVYTDRVVAIAVPSKLEDSLVQRANDAAAQPLLDAMIDYLFGEQSVYVWTGSQTVRGGAGWEALPKKFDPGAETRRTLGGKLILAGAVTAGTGAALTAVGLAAYLPNASPKPGEIGDAYTRRVQTASRGAGLATGGLATLAVGAVALGMGIPISLTGNASDVQLAPMWVAGGAGVSIGISGHSDVRRSP